MTTRFLMETDYGPLLQATATGIEALVDEALTNGVVFVADVLDGTRIVGMIGMRIAPAAPELSRLVLAEEIAWWVEPEHRNGPVGPKLLWAAEAWAVQKGANLCKMVAPAESKVGTFYVRVGYQAVETAYVKVLKANGSIPVARRALRADRPVPPDPHGQAGDRGHSGEEEA